MRQEETRLQDEIAQAWAENKALKAQLASVTAPAFLEKWARVEGRMTLPSEVALIPISLPQKRGQQSSQGASEAFAPDPSSIPEQWHRLFFQVPSKE
jgi:hypothetical protein